MGDRLRDPAAPADPPHPSAPPHVLKQLVLLQYALPLRQMLPPLPDYIWQAHATAAAALGVAALHEGMTLGVPTKVPDVDIVLPSVVSSMVNVLIVSTSSTPIKQGLPGRVCWFFVSVCRGCG